ncbi:hypothetical protein E2C01_053090 [Portunus trituberculatus]|uniref:Uncharacterized protein n=1 Tax=Portunus trituberculatus TaxID=210409 RepID=A0A5B7GNJ8_PORTR|nr:hypothetical protein [Portunus trituberculatus]
MNRSIQKAATLKALLGKRQPALPCPSCLVRRCTAVCYTEKQVTPHVFEMRDVVTLYTHSPLYCF